MNFDYVLIIIVIILLILIVFDDKIEDFTTRKKVCSSDNRCYKVIEKFDNNKEAAELLVYINKFTIELIRHMRKKYLWDGQGSLQHRRLTQNLIDNYNPDSIIENNPKGTVNTSYVEDKGKVIAICLREKNSGKNMFHDRNIIEFVVMHELSHIGSDVIGHEDLEFWINFKILMRNAIELGLHNPINYEKNPVVYCSLKVDYSPMYDIEVPG
jgi:hypothetical protein